MTDAPVRMLSNDEASQGLSQFTPEDIRNRTSLLAVADVPASLNAPVARTSGDAPPIAPPVEATDASAGRPVVAPTGAPIDANQILDAIKIQKADLARLFDESGALKEGNITFEGHQLTTAQYRDMVIARISLMFEAAIEVSKQARVPGNDGRIAQGNQTAGQIEKELKDKYGIELPKGFGGKLTSYTVEQQLLATSNPQAKELLGRLRDTILGVTTAAVNQHQPDQVTMQYAEFLRTVGLTRQADTLLKEVTPNTVSRFSKQFEDLTNKINNDFATARAKVVPPEQDPFISLGIAKAKMAAGDNAGAEAAFANAYKQIEKLPNEKIEAEAKRIAEAQDAVDKQIKEMDEAGLLTPAKDAQLKMQKQNLIMLQSIWEEFLLAKQFVEIDHAHYLLNNSPTKNTEATRRAALDMIDDVRFTDKGKIALIRHLQLNGEERFTRDITMATQGKPQSIQAFVQYRDSMALATKAQLEAQALLESDSDAAEVKMKQCRMHAENALGFAKHVDAADARYQADQARKNVQRLIDTEKAKTDGTRNEGKIALLQHLLKPVTERDPATMVLLDNVLQAPDKVDQQKLKQLRDIVKDDLSMMDVAQLHSTMVDAHGMEHAANSARFTMLQVDVASGNGENNPLAAEIEANDPENRFRSMLNWADVQEKTRDIAWYEHLWRGTKDIFIGLAASLVAAGTFAVLTGSTLGFGAPVGVAGGVAAGTSTYLALKKLSGDDLTLGDVGMGVVNSIPGVAFVSTGRALKGAAIMLKLPGFARPAATLFLQGMAANASYHGGAETLHYAQGLHPDMLSALKKASSRTLADVPSVALFSVLGGGASSVGSQSTRTLGVRISNQTARDVIRTWGQMSISSEPSLFEDRREDALMFKHTDMLLERLRKQQQQQPNK